MIRADQQVEGFDYREIFAPSAKTVSVCCFLSVVVAQGWELHEMDVNTAFLYWDLDEEVYMTLSPSFHAPASHKVCKLKKSLFGLKQAPRQCFANLFIQTA